MNEAIHATIEHSNRVSNYIELLRDDLIKIYKLYNKDNLKDSTIYNSLYVGAKLHDIGKFIIPSRIILKNERLSKYEYSIIKSHTIYGVSLLDKYTFNNTDIDKTIIKNIILNHHERVDGCGYPNHLKRNNIPIEARIIAVLDSLDAMTSNRGYNKTKSLADAIKELNICCGTQFDTDVVDIVTKLVEGDNYGLDKV